MEERVVVIAARPGEMRQATSSAQPASQVAPSSIPKTDQSRRCFFAHDYVASAGIFCTAPGFFATATHSRGGLVRIAPGRTGLPRAFNSIFLVSTAVCRLQPG